MATNSSRRSAFETSAATRSLYVEQYLAKNRVLDVIQAALTKLALAYKTKHQLPANPYPALLAPIRQAEQLQPDEQGNTSPPLTLELVPGAGNQNRVQELRVFALKGVQPPVWGLRSSLERISTDALSSAVNLLGELFPSWTRDLELLDDGYAITVSTALVGNCTVLPVAYHHVIKTERHVFVQGKLLECAMELFAKQLLKFLHEMKQLKAGNPPVAAQLLSCDGITISSAAFSPSQYLLEDASSNRNAFTNAVKTALVSHGQFQSTSFFCVPQQQQPLVIKAEHAFFFHFTSPSDAKQQKSNPNASNRDSANRSFLFGSQVQESGLFLSGRAATIIAERLQPKKPLGQSLLNNQTRSKPLTVEATVASNVSTGIPAGGSAEMLESTLSSFQVNLTQKAADVAREWSHKFMDSVAYTILCAVSSNEMLINVVQRPNSIRDADRKFNLRVLFAVISERMASLLERAQLASASSLLLGVEALVAQLWHCIQEAIDSDGCPTEDCIEPLERLNALLMMVARSAATDFKQLVKTSETASESSLNSNVQPEQGNKLDDCELVDVMQALDQAAMQRTYPPCILEEALFAQWLVDSYVDIALESAVMHLVAFRLPTNAFIELSGYLRVFSLRQLVWSRSLTNSAPSSGLLLDPEQLCWHDNDQICSIIWSSDGTKRLYSATPMLLRLVSTKRMTEWHQKLLDLQIYRSSDYIPSKSSYSVQTFMSIQLFHPILLANRTIPEPPAPMHLEMNVTEHLVVEGADFDQALLFFADAVASDLQRLGRIQWFAPALVELLDPKAKHIAYVAVLEHSRESLLEVVREAAAARYLVQISIVQLQDGQTPLCVHSVIKSYAFHHRPTDKGALVTTRLSDVMWTRLQAFGVFQSLENARIVLGGARNAPKSNVERGHWTSYGQQALTTRDLFLINQLDLVDESNTQSECQLQRLVNHSSVVDLYNLESISRWLLQQIQDDNPLNEATPRLATSGALVTPTSPKTRTYAALVRGLLAAAEESVTRINNAMGYVDPTELVSIQGALEQVLPSAKEKQHQPEQIWVPHLRRLWLLLLYVRFSYQRDFYANCISDATDP